MEKEAIEFVLAALPKGRTVFYDFGDRYAVLLLSHALANGEQSISAIKSSQFAPLLQKPTIKDITAKLGRSWLAASDLEACWPHEVDAYRLTLSAWPGLDEKPRREWHQVSRQGYSLVLQLNMPVSHRRELHKSIENWQSYTSYGSHPVAADELTLAWARIDLDFPSGEALVEEIQSDWVRDVKYYANSKYLENQSAWQTYRDYLEPRAKHWSRTIMTATLWFLLEELGIKTIFFHTHETGQKMKQIRYSAPPRSIYTDLPKSFCFRTTHNGPRFLRDAEDRHIKSLFSDPETTWFVHNFDQVENKDHK